MRKLIYISIQKGGTSMQNDYKRFDIVMVDFGANTIGSEQGYTRPALIVQNNQGNSFSSCTIVIPFTHVLKGLHIPTHALIKKGAEKGLKVDSVLLGEQIRVISEKRIIKKIGSVTDKNEQREIRRVYEANFGE